MSLKVFNFDESELNDNFYTLLIWCSVRSWT